MDSARVNYGQFLLENNDFKQAAEQFATAEQLAPTSVLAQTGLGLALFQQDDDKIINQALTHFQRAVELATQDKNTNLNLAVCLVRLDRKEEAKLYFQKTSQITRKKPNVAE
ncbi:MAG: hypothetical protein JXM70_12690 [Pirellulales bacterium]|nr:hypothetical protein [Pirellulales bacterium]